MNKPLIIVTGASSGIGEAVARLFSAQGHPLLLLARRVERLLALGLPATLCKGVDVTDREALLAAVKEAEAQYGPADAIVNNAGVMLLGDTATQAPEQWERMLDVNVKGLLNGIHAVLGGMIERNHGTVINVGSVAGRCSATPPMRRSSPATRTGRPAWAAWCCRRTMWPMRSATPTNSLRACASARSCWRRPASRPDGVRVARQKLYLTLNITLRGSP